MCREDGKGCDGADKVGEKSHGGGIGNTSGSNSGDSGNGGSGRGSSNPDLCQMYGEDCGGGGKPQFMPTQQDNTGCNDDICELYIPNDPEILDNIDLYFDIAYWATIIEFTAGGFVIGEVGGALVGGAYGWYEASVIDGVRDEILAAANSGNPLIIGTPRTYPGINISGEGDNRGTVVNTPIAFFITYSIFHKQIDHIILSP
jgi:hypothetical protein